jgi:hypothetical protein
VAVLGGVGVCGLNEVGHGPGVPAETELDELGGVTSVRTVVL